jgi:sensor histidine kinase regulating citrate/malate metabolism
MFTLEKIRILDGANSMVGPGHRVLSTRLAVFLSGVHKAKEIKDVHEIQLGWQVLIGTGMNYLNTSPVQEILDKGDSFIKFRTQTSIYELTEQLN